MQLAMQQPVNVLNSLTLFLISPTTGAHNYQLLLFYYKQCRSLNNWIHVYQIIICLCGYNAPNKLNSVTYVLHLSIVLCNEMRNSVCSNSLQCFFSKMQPLIITLRVWVFTKKYSYIIMKKSTICLFCGLVPYSAERYVSDKNYLLFFYSILIN